MIVDIVVVISVAIGILLADGIKTLVKVIEEEMKS